MTNAEAKQIIANNKDNTGYFNKSVNLDDMYEMLRQEMKFGEAETKVILASLTLAGAKFK